MTGFEIAATGNKRDVVVKVDAIMDERRCEKCRHLYGFTPWRQVFEERPQFRYAEHKWCPVCEDPHRVVLRPMVWRGMPVTPMAMTAYEWAKGMIDRYDIGGKMPEKELTIVERLARLGLTGEGFDLPHEP